MSRDQGIGILLAVAIHLLALFAVRLSKPPVPLPIGNDPIQVNLVAAASEPPSISAPAAQAEAVAASEEAPPPSTPEPTPITTPQPTPPPEPTPSPVQSSPTPVATPHATSSPKASPRPNPVRRKSNPIPTRKNSPAAKKSKDANGAPSQSHGTTNRSGTASSAGRGDTAPSYRSNPQPPYPADARRLGQQGLVLLDVLVSAEGRAMKVTVKRSSGVRILDQAAASAVRRWSFEPGRIAGIPAISHVDVPVRFRLDR